MCGCNPFQAAMKSRLTQTVEVLRPTESRDRFGATTADQNRVAHRYQGRLLYDGRPKDPTVIADKSAVSSSWRVLIPLESDVLGTDLIRVEGQTFEIIATDKGRAGASFMVVFVRKYT